MNKLDTSPRRRDPDRAEGPARAQAAADPDRRSRSCSASRWCAAPSSSPTRSTPASTRSSPTRTRTPTRSSPASRRSAARAERARRSRSRCSRRSRRCPDVARRRRRRRRPGAVRRPERQGRSSTGGAPGLGFSINPARPALQPADARRRALAARLRTRSRSTSTPPTSQHYKVGDRSASSRAPGQDAAVPDRRRSSSSGGVATLGGATLAIFDLPTAQALFHKEGQLDQIASPRSRGVSAPSSSPRSSRSCRRTRRCAPAQQQAKQDASRHATQLVVPAVLPARVRRHRALRRRVRDREHAVDHDRAADARVRDAADGRRDPAARCSARHRSRRSSIGVLASIVGALPRPAAREGHGRALLRPSASTCRRPGPSSRRGP